MLPERENIYSIMNRFDSGAMTLLFGSLPDPVVAHVFNTAPGTLRGRLFGAVKGDRMRTSIQPLMAQGAQADPEKDQIVAAALRKFANDLMAAGKIVREGDYFCEKV